MKSLNLTTISTRRRVALALLMLMPAMFISRLSAEEPAKAGGASQPVAIASPLGANLLPQGSFENWTEGKPDGWKVSTQKGKCEPCATVVAVGKLSLQIQIPKGGGALSLISPDIPIAPGYYLARFMMRVEGLSKSQSFEGGQAGVFLQWLDGQNKMIRQTYISWSYIPMELGYRDQIFLAPEGTAAIRVGVEMYGNDKMPLDSTAWFDDVALCSYTPPKGIGEKAFSEWSVTDGRNVLRTPDAPGWGYLAGIEPGQGVGSIQAERVRDGLAMFGSALYTKPGVPPGMVYHTAYTVEQPPGLYRVYVRVRIPEKPPWKLDAPVFDVDVIHSTLGGRGGRAIRASDFQKPGAYEEFWFDIVKPSTGWLAYRVSTPGKDVESWLDLIRVVQLVRFSDPDLLSWYPGLAGSLGSETAIDNKTPLRALVVEGLLGECYRLGEAVQLLKGMEASTIRTEMGMAGGSIPKFPSTWKELCSYRLVVLANASLESLGPEQRYQLRKFVEIGGGLLFLGGKSAYGNGGIRGSFMEEAVPLQVAETRFDIAPSKDNLKLVKNTLGLELELPDTLKSPFIHRAAAKPGAAVLAQAGKEPFIVAGSFGKGRIVCLLGTQYGDAPEGSELFTAWKDYPILTARLMAWLCPGDEK